jgi:hypothetical protein
VGEKFERISGNKNLLMCTILTDKWYNKKLEREEHREEREGSGRRRKKEEGNWRKGRVRDKGEKEVWKRL